MKTRIMSFCLSFVSLALVAGSVVAQQHQAKASQPSNKEMERAMTAAAPSAVHQQLAKRVGTYSTVTRLIPQPGAPAIESSGSARIISVLDGRFLREEDSGTFMGQESAGLRLWGYNNAARRYEACWTYTMSTAIMTMTGASADGGKTVNMKATFDDENGSKQTFKVTIRQLDDDHFVVELVSQTADGKNGAALTTSYSRTK